MLLKHDDFEKILNFKFSDNTRKAIDLYAIEVDELGYDEFLKQINFMISILIKEDIVKAGSHRKDEWNSGWNENNIEFRKTHKEESLLPKYFGKYEYVRLRNKLLKTTSTHCEINMLRVLQHYIYEKYCLEYENFYEFGCGTGHNLVAIYKMEEERKRSFFGLDWSESPRNIFININKYINKNFDFERFDFTEPNYDITFKEKSVIFTFAALEQIGNRYEKYIDFLLEKKPNLCIHVEPISELLDKQDLLQNLSIEYIRKRNYLTGFLSFLKTKEEEKKIEILETKRTTIGSYLIEGYSLVIWRIK